MVSSNLSRRITLLIALLTLCLSSYGQSVKNYYVSRMVDGGTLYFLFQQTLFHAEDGTDLTYDLTYLTASDSLSMNITIVSDDVLILGSMKIESECVNIKDDLKRLYIEPDGKQWAHRYSMTTKSEQFFNLYDPNSNPKITVYSGDKSYDYSVKHAAWKKYAPVGSRIFDMIKIQQTVPSRESN